MLKRTTKLTIKIAMGALLIALLATTSFVIWVITGPRSLPILSKYVEQSFNALSDDYVVQIEYTVLAWDGWQRAFTVKALDVSLENDTEDTIAHFPQIELGINVGKLFTGSSLFSDLTIVKPAIWVNTAPAEEYVRRKPNTTFYRNILDKFIHPDQEFSGLPISHIRVKEADVYLSNGQSDIAWRIKEGYLRLETENGTPTITSEFDMSFGNRNAFFEITSEPAKNNTISPKIRFTQLPSLVLLDLFPKLEIPETNNVVIDGTITPNINIGGTIEYTDFTISKAKGQIDLPNIFPKPLEIANLTGSGQISESGNIWQLRDLKIRSDNNTAFTINTTLTNNSGDIKKFRPDIDLTLNIEKLDIDEIKRFWPLSLATNTRNWIVTHLSKGHVSKASLQIKATAAQLAKPPMLKENLSASITFKGAHAILHRKFPVSLINASGTASFSAKDLQVNLTGGNLKETNIQSARITIPDFAQKPPIVEVYTQAKGPIHNLLTFFRPYISKDSPLMQAHFDYVEGTAVTDLSLSFPTAPIEGKEDNSTSFDLSSKLSIDKLDKATPNIDLSKGKFQLDVDKNGTSFKGQGLFNNVALDYELKIDTNQTKKQFIAGNVSPSEIATLGFADLPYIHGKMAVELYTTEKKNSLTTKGRVNLGKPRLTIPKWGFTKPEDSTATLEFETAQSQDGSIIVSNIKAKGELINMTGRMKFAPNFEHVSQAKFSQFNIGNNRLAIDYQHKDTKSTLAINGKNLDFSKAELNQIINPKDNKPKAFELEANIETITLKNDQTLNNVSLTSKCDATLCKTMNFYGTFPNESFVVASYKPINDERRTLLFESNDAGQTLKALDVSKHITGGTLELQSVSELYEGRTIAEGVLKIQDFKATKTPILGKLLTLASLKGIGELLEGQGIGFKTFEAPFSNNGGVITVKQARTSGSSVGLTAKGTINTNSGELDLEGTIVPAHAINRFLGKIPIVGPLLTGGEGEGVIASTYKVKGTTQDAKVTVNPLTMIAPGFLRNLFDIIPDSKESEVQGPPVPE